MTVRSTAIALALLAAIGPLRAQAGLREKRVGLSLGTGGGGWSFGGSTASFVDALARDPLRVSFGVEGDARLRDWVRAGLRSSTLWLHAGSEGTRTSLLLTRLEAVAVLRPPWQAGPFARTGAGPAAIWHAERVPGLASGSMGAGGGAVSVAVGGFVERHGVELRIEAEGSAQAWLAPADGPDWSWTVIGSVGAAWGW